MTNLLLSLLYLFFNFLTFVICQGVVTAPMSGTVWTNGGTGQISWSNVPGTSFSIVLNRINTVYHHTITSTAANTGSYVWSPVDIPGQDGWPPSSSTDLVYQIDLYVGGGWNNGGSLVAQSSPFAIIWDETTTIPDTVTTVYPVPNGVYLTTTRTVVVMGVVTTTIYVTELVQAASTPQDTILAESPNTVTITNTQQLNTITQTVAATTVRGGNSSPQAVLYNSGAVGTKSPTFPYFRLAVIMCGVLGIF
jgi:hypothetical protein